MPDTILFTGAVDGDLSETGNYSPAQLPITGDTLIFFSGTQDVDTALDTLAAVVLAKLVKYKSYTGKIGTATAYMEVGATICDLEVVSGPTDYSAGSTRIMLNLKTDPSTVTVHDSASSAADTNLPPIRLLCDDVATVVNVRKGHVGIAVTNPTETSTLATVNVNYVSNVGSDAMVRIGSGVTLTTLTKNGGDVRLNCAATTVTQREGTLTTEGTGAITTFTNAGGTARPNSTGTITTLNANGGLVDFLGSSAARTVTTLAAADGSTGQVQYDPSTLTVTNKLAPAGRTRITLSRA